MAVAISSYLVITALGTDNTKVVNQLTQSLTSWGGNILDTRMTSLGNEFGMMLLVEGSWGAIAKIESNLPAIEEKLGLSANIRRTTPRLRLKKTMTYSVHAVTVDRDGILNDLAQFFNAENIDIEDVNAHTYIAHTGTRMSSMTININVPVDTHTPTLREKFMLHCDNLNLDASLEPLRD